MSVLGCSTCKSNCCSREKSGRGGTITIFEPELGAIPGGSYIQEMPIEDDSCVFLSKNKVSCTIYNHPKKPITCKLYPFVIDAYDNLLLSTTCPDYSKIINGLMNNNIEVIKMVLDIYELAVKAPLEAKLFWTNLTDNWPILIKIDVDKYKDRI